MARVSPPPVVMYSPSLSEQQMLPTPSSFANSLESSGGWRSSPTTHLIFIISLRFIAFLFSAVSFLVLLAAPPLNNKGRGSPNILHYHEFRYCLVIAISASIYSALQLSKGIHDISFKGQFISDNICDCITFVGDQLAAYFLVSSSSAATPAIQRIDGRPKRVAIASVSMSFFAFLVIAICTLISGYKLCKRTIW